MLSFLGADYNYNYTNRPTFSFSELVGDPHLHFQILCYIKAVIDCFQKMLIFKQFLMFSLIFVTLVFKCLFLERLISPNVDA